MDDDVGIEGGELIELAQQRLRVLLARSGRGAAGRRRRARARSVLLADSAGGGHELVGVGSFVRRATFREQAQLVAAPLVNDLSPVAWTRSAVGPSLCERLVGLSELARGGSGLAACICSASSVMPRRSQNSIASLRIENAAAGPVGTNWRRRDCRR